ncbi:ubiquitin-associated (UBA)/TS-N domain-containing protein [Actinidia rufa]|uniref:Ubiquitin-associated (UBA)/TS-N domain-containing protein n=1 Tax=Actinidia rufa TaxID=165716 RepID=A0A7J0E2Y2_9ERIC|nr:ubiquitin-associated (UBA)/TS-N domain-containing protein [Actinidia rufa]
MAKLKIGGSWSGALEVELENWTVPMLRKEVARRSQCGEESINLICAGKVLKDGDGTQKLSQLGVKNNAKVLASRVLADQGQALKDELMAEDEQSSRLTRLKGSQEPSWFWAMAFVLGCMQVFGLGATLYGCGHTSRQAAVTLLAKRHADGSLPIEDFNLELENQSGEAVQLGSETDQRAVMMGLMLHANAKQLI